MTNHGGCAILNEMITYPDRKETRKKFQKTGMPWWSNEKANLLLVPIFSAMDGTVLYSIMEECFLQSALMSIVMAFGVAVVLNILPLVIAKFLHGAIYKTTKHGLTMFAVFVAGFLLVYGGTVYLRFAYSDMYEQENQSMTLEILYQRKRLKTVRKMYKRFLKTAKKYGGGNSVINQPFNYIAVGFCHCLCQR